VADKVKISMFLPPAVARAAKVQAARAGAGLSDLVSGIFQCAYCREPITDEFVVGTPRLVASNNYAVFFHKNREACLAASRTRVNFFVKCPNCGDMSHQSFGRSEMQGLLEKEGVRFYCISCNNSWKATAGDNANIVKIL
jgi:hypothetical protein